MTILVEDILKNSLNLFSAPINIICMSICDMYEIRNKILFNLKTTVTRRSGGSVVDRTLNFQSRDHKIDPTPLWSFR